MSFLTIALLLPLALACNITTCIFGNCQNNVCICSSGARDSACSTSVENCDDYFLNISSLSSSVVPVVEYSSLRNGFLEIAVRTPLVWDRKATNIFLRSESDHPECAYPFWQKTFSNCEERYALLLPWTVAVQCGWIFDDTSVISEVSFSNDIYIRHTDEVGLFRDLPIYRETSHVLSVVVKFRTSVEVGTNQLTVTAPVTLLTAITSDVFDPQVMRGTVNFTTSLQWPFVLSSYELLAIPNGLFANLSLGRETCPSTSGNCLQEFSISVQPGTACSLSGLYSLGFLLTCRGNPVDCPLEGGVAVANITAQILSDDFCTFLTIDIGLRATLGTYDSGTLLTEKTTFLQGGLVFGGLQVSSEAGVLITGTSIRSIVVSDNTTEVFLRSNAQTLDIGDSLGLEVNNFNPDAPWFQFQLSPMVFNVVPDTAQEFEMIIILDVTYLDESSKKKRQRTLDLSLRKRQEIAIALPAVNRAEDTKASTFFNLENSAMIPGDDSSSSASTRLNMWWSS